MKRKKYDVPTMDVVEVKQQVQLLAGSGVESTRLEYGTAVEETWED